MKRVVEQLRADAETRGETLTAAKPRGEEKDLRGDHLIGGARRRPSPVGVVGHDYAARRSAFAAVPLRAFPVRRFGRMTSPSSGVLGVSCFFAAA